MVQYRLPDREDETPEAATIRPTSPPRPLPPIQPEMQQRSVASKEAAAGIVVPTRLLRPHPVIAAWLSEREEERARARRERDPWMRSLAPSDWTESERRRHRILDALFKAAEKQGLSIRQPDRFSVYLEAAGERIDFKIKEKHKQVRTPRTAEETKRLLPGERTWRQLLQPTGPLVFHRGCLETSPA